MKSIQRTRKAVLLLSGAAIVLVLIQRTAMAGARIDDPLGTALVLLSEIQVTDAESGSQITIAADAPIGAVSTRLVGAWFEVRIQNADTSRAQRKFAGRGFDQGHVVQSGIDAVLLMRLQRGATARAFSETSLIQIVVSAAAARESNSSTTISSTQALDTAPGNQLLALRAGTRSAEPKAVSQMPGTRLVTIDDLPVLSKETVALRTPAPVSPSLNFVSTQPSLIVISDEPPARIVRNQEPSVLRKINLTFETVAPKLDFPDTLIEPTRIVLSEEPPAPKILATNLPLPALRTSVSLTGAGPTPIAIVFDGSRFAAPTVSVSDDPPPVKPVFKNQPPPPPRRQSISLASAAPTSIIVDGNLFPAAMVSVSEEPPPPAQTKVASAKPPVLKSSPTANRVSEETNKPVERTESATDAEEREAVAAADVTESEPAKIVDPTKPAPTQINLPKAPLPRARGRAPLSQERRFELSGVISIDYAKTNQTSTVETGGLGDPIRSHGHNLGIGLDMHLGTFVIDPRFVKISFDTGFTTNRGGFDEFTTRQGNKGAGFYVDFLPTSQYPLRFHFTRQNTHFLEQQISSASTGRRSLGFDWSLRKPHLPNLSVNFDDTSYTSNFVASSSFKSQSKTLSVGLTDKVKGWDVNSNFSRQSATEGITNLKTNLDFLRFDARRQLSKKSNLFVTSFLEKLRFNNPRTNLAQDFSFFDLHTDYSLQQTKKLSFRAAHQFYYSSDDQTATPGDSTTAHKGDSALAPSRSITSFNSVQGQVNYRLWPALLVSGTANARFIKTPDTTSESATRFLDFAASLAWNKRLGFAETRASFVEGITHVRSNFGVSRGVEFRSYAAGVSMGRVNRALVTADFNSTSRPDAFQIGGSFSQDYFNVAVETSRVSRFRIRASAGQNILDYVTTSGREHLKNLSYSLSIDDKWFTVLLNHNSSSGVRDVFLVPITVDNTRIFRVLPVDALLRDPLLNGSAVFTLGLVRFKPRQDLDLEVRYLRDRAIFARTNDVFTQQFDALARYKLGKITLTGGFIIFEQDTEALFRRDRKYLFFRLSRPFTLF